MSFFSIELWVVNKENNVHCWNPYRQIRQETRQDRITFLIVDKLVTWFIVELPIRTSSSSGARRVGSGGFTLTQDTKPEPVFMALLYIAPLVRLSTELVCVQAFNITPTTQHFLECVLFGVTSYAVCIYWGIRWGFCLVPFFTIYFLLLWFLKMIA